MFRRHALKAFLPLWLSLALPGMGQEALPSFSATIRSGRTLISWTNPYEKVVQVSVQRSADSLFGFRTIVTMPDPSLAANGFMDVTAPDNRQFYRLYVQLPYGRFFQTAVKRPSLSPETPSVPPVIPNPSGAMPAKPVDDRTVRQPSVTPPAAIPLPEDASDYEQIIRKTKMVAVRKLPWRHLEPGDPMATALRQLTVVLPANLFTPSPFLFTNREGNVVVAMPQRNGGRFSVHFFLPEGTPLFQFDIQREPILILDKVNFQRSGWFDFEIRQDGQVKERNRIFIPKTRL